MEVETPSSRQPRTVMVTEAVPTLPLLASTRAPNVPDHEMIRLIGRGSYGEVWLARNAIGTLRAVKVVRRSEFKEERPFLRELSGIQKYEPVSRAHEGLVDILHVGRNESEGFYYAVMELADSMHGADLEQYEPRTLTHVLRERGRLSVAECIPLFLSLAGALSFLHDRGLVHRDVKPSNIIFVNGAAKLADIGLVAAESDAASYVGTEGFIPPEGPGSRLADIYALGKVFYEAATGLDRTEFPTLPIQAADFEANRDLLELNAVIVKACESNSADRYQSAAELHADLALLQSGKSVKDLRLVEARLRHARKLGALVAIAAILATGVSEMFRYKARIANQNLRKEAQLRQRAEKAEAGMREELWNARLAEARAVRAGGLAGRRFVALAALTNAAKIRVDSSIRSEVAACLSLVDIRPLDLGRKFEPHKQILAWDAAMERYAEALTNGEILIRRAADHSVEKSFSIPPRPGADSLEFSPSGNYLRLRYRDGNMDFWRITSNGFVKATPPGPAIDAFSFTADERMLAAGRGDRFVRVYDLDSGKEISQFEAGLDVQAVHFSPNGQFIAVNYQATNLVQIWDWKQQTVVRNLTLPLGVYTVAWSPDEPVIAMATVDYRIHVWDTQSWEEKQILVGHQGQIIELEFLPGETGLVSVSWDGTMRFWDIRSGIALWRLLGSGPQVHYNPATRRLGFQLSDYSDLALFELVPDYLARQLRQPEPPNSIGPSTGNFTPDGRFLATGSSECAVIWNLAENKIVNRIGEPDVHDPVFDAASGRIYLAGYKGLARYDTKIASDKLEFWKQEILSRNICAYICQATNGALAWYDRESVHVRQLDGAELTWKPNHRGLEGIAISPDAHWLVTGTRNARNVRLWDATTGKFIRERHCEWGGLVQFAGDSSRFLAGSTDEYVMWDVATGEAIWKIPRSHPDANLAGRIAFSPDGKTIALAETRSVIKLVEAATGHEIISLEHSVPEIISRLTFSPQGDLLAALCETHVIQVWDFKRLRTELARLNLDWPDPQK